MNKILLTIALLGIILISGCVNSITEIVDGNSSKIDITYFYDICRWDTDCIMTHCRDASEYVCRNSIKTLTEIRCQDLGGLVSEKNYDTCGCIDSVCKEK